MCVSVSKDPRLSIAVQVLHIAGLAVATTAFERDQRDLAPSYQVRAARAESSLCLLHRRHDHEAEASLPRALLGTVSGRRLLRAGEKDILHDAEAAEVIAQKVGGIEAEAVDLADIENALGLHLVQLLQLGGHEKRGELAAAPRALLPPLLCSAILAACIARASGADIAVSGTDSAVSAGFAHRLTAEVACAAAGTGHWQAARAVAACSGMAPLARAARALDIGVLHVGPEGPATQRLAHRPPGHCLQVMAELHGRLTRDLGLGAHCEQKAARPPSPFS
mmetsp:Transcript_70539/g.181826  ORF Transcript_70539/g.181826 Transcript_70539/m.181826 type:complete len:279 (+) Transcript_70539:520-1356(+)